MVPYRRKYFNDELFDLIDRDIQKAREYYRGEEGDEESSQQGIRSLAVHTSQWGRKGGPSASLPDAHLKFASVVLDGVLGRVLVSL